jgi:steroid delta-isomerase-like uncharacterized protein
VTPPGERAGEGHLVGERTAKDVCTSYLASFATGDPDCVAAHVTDDFVNEHTAAIGRSSAGKEEYRTRLPGFLASMPGLRYEVDDVAAEGDVEAATVFAAYTLRCTVHGREIAVRGVMRFEVRDGRIAKRTDWWDSKVFEQQAGLA